MFQSIYNEKKTSKSIWTGPSVVTFPTVPKYNKKSPLIFSFLFIMGAGKNLEHTPAVAVFSVFVFFLVVSVLVEKMFHHMHHRWEHKGQHGLLAALEKVKEELMLMGFCSLILIVFEDEILSICTDIRPLRGIPIQMKNKCPCAWMYYRDFVEKDHVAALAAEKVAAAGSAASSAASSGGGRLRFLGSASSSGAGDKSPRTQESFNVDGPTYNCATTGCEGVDGPIWTPEICCARYTNLQDAFKTTDGASCTAKYYAQAGGLIGASSSASSSNATSSATSSGGASRRMLLSFENDDSIMWDYSSMIRTLTGIGASEASGSELKEESDLWEKCQKNEVCRAWVEHQQGRRPQTGRGRRLAGAGPSCPAGKEPFIEQAALHQTHTVIFYIAMVHISLGCFIMMNASRRVKIWAQWELYGDGEDEEASDLWPPKKRTGFAKYACAALNQFTKSVSAATYIAIRRYYISRLDKKVMAPEEYKFNEKVRDHMNEKFGQIIGIEPWMWLTLGAQIVLEGYGYGTWNLFTQLAFGAAVIAGTKLQMLNTDLTRKVYMVHGCLKDDAVFGKGSISQESLHKMQLSTEATVLDQYEPDFWFDDPTILETMIKFCLWQNSVSLTLFVYFSVQFEALHDFHTCFWESRTIIGTIPDMGIVFFTIFTMAFAVVPVYGVISLSADHNEKMTKRRMSKMLKHTTSHHGGHGAEHGSGHGDKPGHGGHGGHGTEKNATKVAPAGALSSWCRE